MNTKSILAKCFIYQGPINLCQAEQMWIFFIEHGVPWVYSLTLASLTLGLFPAILIQSLYLDYLCT